MLQTSRARFEMPSDSRVIVRPHLTSGMKFPKVAMVIVGEDCALPDTGNSTGRRGLCGNILVHKVGMNLMKSKP